MIKTALRAALALALLVTVASAQQVWRWSTTSATNSTADPAISWVTGMAPSQVSPSSRAMMAAVAKWRDDTSGVLGTLGTASAYTITSNSSFSATPQNGQSITATFTATNAANATLAVDGGTAFPIQTGNSAISAGVIVAGTPYTLNFNSFEAKWKLQHFQSSPFVVPLGAVLDYTGATAPNSNFVLANGQCISRTTYAAYFALVSTTFGVCDGVTTFGVPDLSNRMVAGTAMGGTNRITVAGGNIDGTVLGGTGGLQNSTLTTAQIPSHTHAGTTASDGAHTNTGSTGIESANHTHAGTTDNGGVDHQHVNNISSPASVSGNVAAGVNPGYWSGTSGFSPTGVATAYLHTHPFATGGVSANHVHSFTTDSSGAHPHSFTSNPTGGGASHSILPPVMLLSKIVRIF